jgi:hypothetical protein
LTSRDVTLYHRDSSEEPDQVGGAAEEIKMIRTLQEIATVASFIAAMVLLLALGSMR